MIVNVILAILVLSVIIIVHEFGHFIVAKANGVTVLEFALGFGPKLIHFKRRNRIQYQTASVWRFVYDVRR